MPRNTTSLFVILPNLNIWNADRPGGSQRFLQSASRLLHTAAAAGVVLAVPRGASDITLLDEVAPRDTVLVAMNETQRVELLRAQPGLRVVPVTRLEPLWLQRFRLVAPIGIGAAARLALEVTVVDATSGAPLAGVDVVGLVNRALRIGVMHQTNAKGIARLVFPAGVDRLEAVQAVATAGYWPSYAANVALAEGRLTLACRPIDLAAPDARRHFGFEGKDNDGQGVRVAVVDTGAADHPDLRIAKACNVVKGESGDDISDRVGHGTHVCGIIAGRGAPGRGVRGVAPGVDLHVYRVFGANDDTALSFSIAKGIRQAVDDGCDLVNLSLGAAADMPEILREIQRARALGVLCLAAAGNDYRAGVSYPARYSQVLSVSAFGRKGTYPAGAAQELDEAKPFGADHLNFIAAFSNVGSEIDLTGPGVGIVSTYPGGYAVMDGTSMACPVATGALARQLGKQARILRMDRDQKRSDAIARLALNTARQLGFGATFEGAGLLV